MEWNRSKVIKMAIILVCLLLGVALFTNHNRKSSMTLSEYAAQYPEKAYGTTNVPE